MLSSALTASAAAFNSQMGAFSKRLGPAVAFIMSALGLRLGLWVHHPCSPPGIGAIFPAYYLFLEMLGLSNTDTHRMGLHLSDGAHFENLALYELVRRHCRYIVVSDCGADQEVAFDDLANATRRVREDFGVEIELDVDPLRPNALGISQQHAVVGTIHYDGPRGSDKGILVYFKPCLAGNEPTDVVQYRTRNPAFPHEGTGDQFYDEAQWESYRRLGEHAGRTIFRFYDTEGPRKHGNHVERLFLGAVEHWQRLIGVDEAKLSSLVHERDQLLDGLRETAPGFLRGEFFSEIVSTPDQSSEPTDRELLDAFHLCIRLVTLMDRIFSVAKLETAWSHGQNQVWMTFFGRCCSAHTIRNWWPLLRPWSSNGLRDFVRIHYGIGIYDESRRDDNKESAVVSLSLRPVESGNDEVRGYAFESWVRTYGQPGPNRRMMHYFAKFNGVPAGASSREICVGLLLYQKECCVRSTPKRNCTVVSWSSPELFVPPALNGSGFSSRLLDAVIAYFSKEESEGEAPVRLKVTIQDVPSSPGGGPAPVQRGGEAHRQAVRDTLQFYRSRGFEQDGVSDGPQSLELVVEPDLRFRSDLRYQAIRTSGIQSPSALGVKSEIR